MKEQAYQGAYSRRFSNSSVVSGSSVVNESSPLKTFQLKVRWNGTKGRVVGSGNFALESDSAAACVANASAVAANTITLTATPKSGYRFAGWRGIPVAGNTNETVTIKMLQNYDVTAVFEAVENPGGGDYTGGDENTGGGENPGGNDYTGGGENPGGGYTPIAPTNPTDVAKTFVKKWWWAILIVAYIAYKEWKGSRK